MLHQAARFFCLLCGILPFISYAKAQQAPKPHLLHWTEKDGLPDNLVFDVHQGQQGWLWVATSNGLCRFDGKEFEGFTANPKNYSSLSGNQVLRILEDKKGDIWLGTDGGGLSIYDRASHRFHTLRQNLENPTKGLVENRVYSILQDREGDTYIGYRAIGSGMGGVSVIGGNRKLKGHFLQNIKDYAGFQMKVTQMLQDPEDPEIFWLAGRSFFKWDRTTGHHKEYKHASFIPNYTSVCGIIPETDSTLLVGMYFDGVWRFNKCTGTWEHALHNIPIRTFCKGPDGKIWLADDQGIGWYDSKKLQVQYLIPLAGESSPFDQPTVINKLVWMDQCLWICTNRGLFAWNPIFDQFNTQQIHLNDAETAYVPTFIGALSANEWLFLDGKKGVVVADSLLQGLRFFSMPQGVTARRASLVDDDPEKWVLIGTNQGLYFWRPAAEKILPLKPVSSEVNLDKIRVWSVYVEEGKAWIGTQTSGLLVLDLETRELRQFLHKPQDRFSLCHNQYLFEIDRDSNGNLWICTDKGISILNPSTEQFVDYPGVDFIKDFVVHCVESDHQGNVWVGTRDQGLFKYNLAKGELINFTTRHGLPYNGVNKLMADQDLLWGATRKGLCQVDLKTDEITLFDKNKGLHNNLLYDCRLSRLPNGETMLSYQNSTFVSRFKCKKLKSYFPPPLLSLSGLRVLGAGEEKKLTVFDHNIIKLGSFDNDFAIDFNGIHFFNAREIIYQYYLEGYDDSWINAGNSNKAIYTNLSGGKYRFKVRASNRDGIWSETKMFDIHLATPWYQTTPFYILLFLLGGLLLYLMYHYRTNQIIKEEYFKRQLAETEMKALRSQINPHFIFNCLNSIKSYIIDNNIDNGTYFVSQFSQLMRMTLSHSRERLIPFAEEIKAIRLYTWLERERLKHKFETRYSLHFESSSEELLIPPLLFQPYVENAIWHGLMNLREQGQLHIVIEEEDQVVVIQILDNGVGCQASRKIKQQSVIRRDSVGLKLAESRLTQINQLYHLDATVEICDRWPEEKNPGTRVTIRFPKIKKTPFFDKFSGRAKI